MQLIDVFNYDFDSGVLTWRCDSGRWGRIRAGTVAGSLRKDGYSLVGIDGEKHLVHRVIWKLIHGHWPVFQIDHIDGNRANNRLENLRDVQPHINSQNQRHARGVTRSGRLGVRSQRNKWSAEIKVDGKRYSLGTRDTADEAHQLYLDAKRRLHPGNTL